MLLVVVLVWLIMVVLLLVLLGVGVYSRAGPNYKGGVACTGWSASCHHGNWRWLLLSVGTCGCHHRHPPVLEPTTSQWSG